MSARKAKKPKTDEDIAKLKTSSGKDVPEDEMDAEEVLKKYDKESNTRIWEGVPKYIVNTLMALFSIYCIFMTLFSTELPETKLARFLGFIVLLGFLMYPVSKRHVRPNSMPWYDIIIMVVGSFAFFYFAFNAEEIIMLTSNIKPLHVILGVVGILAIAELTRRCVGVPILVVAGCLVVYAYVYHFGYGYGFYDATRLIVQKLFYTTSGIIGTPIYVCYTYIVLFIIFGAFLERTGIAGFFISLANRLAGWSSGGAAKVAVISSALCGMVSGSSVGNTVTTGSITIPMMKKTGYKPEFAGAVEAASSTGGQIMPPIMGAAAFLMAEYIGIPYIQVVGYAIIPAVLYFTGIFISVHLEAKKLGLKGIPREQLPKWRYLVLNCYLLIPLVLLVWMVAAGVRTMAYSAAISILIAFVIGAINYFICELTGGTGLGDPNATKRGQQKDVKDALVKTGKNCAITTYEALLSGAKSVLTVACACAMAGIIAGCITITGFASLLINAIVGVAGDATFIGLFLTMLACIVLGMGVPTTANYCIMAATCAPILIQLGIPTVCAHFFVFYFGIVADITPPVALAAYAGSAIARSNPMRTALNASKLAIAAFVVPYIFALNPILLLQGDFVWYELAIALVTCVVGLFSLAAALNGHLGTKISWPVRIIMAAAGLAMMVPDTASDIIGTIVVAACVAFQMILAHRRKASVVEAAVEASVEEPAAELPAEASAEASVAVAVAEAPVAVAVAEAPAAVAVAEASAPETPADETSAE